MCKRFYICNGLDEECKRTNCYTIGGPCHHTDKVKYALNLEEERIMVKGLDGNLWEVGKCHTK